jgi:hypothetical protein
MITEEEKNSYKLTFEERDGYLFAGVTGETDNVDISSQYWKEIADKCKNDGTKKVLIVEDLPGGASMTEVYEVASALPQLGFFGIKIAFVDAHLDQQDVNRFGELVAVNRGLYGKIFNDVSEAEKWLLKD